MSRGALCRYALAAITYNPDAYHRHSIRLRGYDYAQPGAYFLTLVAKDRLPHFDDAQIYAFAQQCWLDLPQHFPRVELDEWVLMPNHLHGIIFINADPTDNRRGVQLNAPTTQPDTARSSRHTDDFFSIRSPQRGTLSVIVRTYKAAVTTLCRRAGLDHFGWQRNYYEHIIRDEDDLNRIRQYILNNPMNWGDDEYNPGHR